jgi:hypothetical protein
MQDNVSDDQEEEEIENDLKQIGDLCETNLNDHFATYDNVPPVEGVDAEFGTANLEDFGPLPNEQIGEDGLPYAVKSKHLYYALDDSIA